jgi:hypothetical protein
LSQSTYVVTANNGTGVVTINQAITGSFVNGDTIKFCVPSGVAGNILTVQTISNTIGRGTSGGTAVQGAGIPTGTSTPMVTDQVNGYFNGGQGNNQYTLIKADLTALSINVGRIVMTLLNGKSWGIDNLTGLEGLHPFTKAGVRFIYSNACDHDLQMDFANLPGLFGVAVDEGAKIGDTYPIKNAAASTGTAIATFGAPATGGGTADVLLRCSAIVGGATNGATAAGVNVLNFAATPTGTVAGMAVSNGDNFNGPFTQTIADNTYVVSTTGTTVTLNNNVMGVGVANGDVIRFYQWTVCGV